MMPAQPLSPYATDPAESRGRRLPEPESQTRNAFQRDRDRIIHSAAFRRLQYKTQVFVYPEGDHYRSRLTHSLEVSQIARGICRQLGLHEDLAEAVALAHDLGHTPFGHAGEDALDEVMRPYGGFDHNAQTLRILTRLERRYAAFDGLNLTWEVLEGAVKHNGPLVRPGETPAEAAARVPAAILEYVAQHDLELATHAGPEAQVAALADDIAYNNHDIDDGLRAGLFRLSDLDDLPLEQSLHRFGVEQRTRLVAKGRSPHVLVMTATPIPRTQALARFGDLDLEILRDRPSGRLPAPAIHVDREAWPRVLRAIARHARRGGRVYVVCPKIGEDGEKGGAVRLAQDLGGRFRCGLVHGRLPVAERRARTAAFRDGAFDVLVGTTVLEVGVDVPTATLMVVVGADRFGLAQLHQLRGRVGRGRKRGACVLIGERSDRVVALCRTRDGFDLAEEDLRLRGAGELLGAQQTGAIDFRALDPLDDYEILRAARDAVRGEEVLPCGP